MSKLKVKPKHVKQISKLINQELSRIAPHALPACTLNVLHHACKNDAERQVMRHRLWQRCLARPLEAMRVNYEVFEYASVNDFDKALAVITKTMPNADKVVVSLNMGDLCHIQ